jgi:hypothetical protein
MYCPKCATLQTDNQRFCRSCGLNLEVISQLLSDETQLEKLIPNSASKTKAARRKKKFHNFGGLVMMLSFIVGAAIPIVIGLGYENSNSLIMILAGIAGILLFSGISIAIMGDVELKEKEIEENSLTYLPPTSEKRLSESQFQPAQAVTEATTNLLDKDTVKVSRTDEK